MDTMSIRVERVYYGYNEGYYACVAGEPFDPELIIGKAVDGFRTAEKDIADWRKTGDPLPLYLDPEIARLSI